MINERDFRSFLEFARPPEGTKLTYCIGTTFTLDYTVLVQLALSTHGYVNEVESASDPEAFSHLSSFDEKAIVFCQNCRIDKIPKEFFKPKKTNRQKLLSLLESVIFSVSPNENLKTFHSKTWLLRFDNIDKKDDPIWKLAVTSRNLTEAKTWEIGLELVGRKAKRLSKDHLGLVPYFNFLKNTSQKNEKAQRLIKKALNDLPEIEFVKPDRISSFEVLPKFPGNNPTSFLSNEKYSEVIAISPFLSREALQELNSIKTKRLITSAKDVRLLSDLPSISENAYLFRLEGLELHAKLYFCAKPNGETDVYLGSSNLTRAALFKGGQNVEVMAKLSSKRPLLKEFERDFMFEKKKPRPWLLPLGKEDFERSEQIHAQDLKQKVLEDIRDRLSEGTFLLKRVKTRTWEIKWSGPRVTIPAGVEARITIAESSLSIDLFEVLNSKAPKIISSSPMAFLSIKLGKKGLNTIEFGAVAEVIGKRQSRGEDIFAKIVSESDKATVLKAILDTRNSSQLEIDHSTTALTNSKTKSKKQNSKLSIDGVVETILLADLDSPNRRKLVTKALSIWGKEDASSVAALKSFWIEYQKALEEVSKGAA